MTTAQKWRKILAWLHRNFPPQSPVYVESILMKKFHGYTESEIGYYAVKINRKQCFALRIDTLIHEWAHCLTWHGAEQGEAHSAEWGMAYAKIYRTFIEWNYGRPQKEEEE